MYTLADDSDVGAAKAGNSESANVRTEPDGPESQELLLELPPPVPGPEPADPEIPPAKKEMQKGQFRYYGVDTPMRELWTWLVGVC